MSARRINNRMMRNQGQGGGYSGNVHIVRHDVVSRKREERMVREAYRRERKMNSYLAEDENFPSFKNQLTKIGLELRDIPGDGNCLFRALGDQFEGHVRNHYRHRQDVVRYMVEHKTDFEPFLSDDISFERHIQNLKSLGCYAGNDAIVAFARLHQVNIIIHQLNDPFLVIQGPSSYSSSTRQIHIAYHNGDHYSSVRKVGDNTESPTNIRLKMNDDSPTAQTKFQGHAGGADGIVRAVRDTDRLTEEVMNATGCYNVQHVLECLCDCDYDVDATIAYVLQTMETTYSVLPDDSTSLASQMTSTDSGIWSENGTHKSANSTDINHNKSGVKGHYRDNSFGGSSGYGSVSSHTGGARPKLSKLSEVNGQNIPKTIPEKQTSSKLTKKQKKLEKKKRAEEKHKQRLMGVQPQLPNSDDNDVVTVVSKDLQMAKI